MFPVLKLYQVKIKDPEDIHAFRVTVKFFMAEGGVLSPILGEYCRSLAFLVDGG